MMTLFDDKIVPPVRIPLAGQSTQPLTLTKMSEWATSNSVSFSGSTWRMG